MLAVRKYALRFSPCKPISLAKNLGTLAFGTHPSKWDPADGDIDLLITDNEELEAQAIAEDIASEITNGTRPNEICILCKQRPMDYASAIISELKTHGISARIETEYQDLIKEPVINLLFRMILCAFDKKRPHDWEYILNFLVCLNGIGTNQVCQEYDQMQEALASQMKYLKTELVKGIDQIYLSNVLNNLIEFFDADKIKANFPEYRQKNRFEELIAKFKELFWKNMNEANGNWQLAVEIFQGFHSVPIMTIHIILWVWKIPPFGVFVLSRRRTDVHSS